MDNKYLTDHYGRNHNYLRISITENCNLRCTYCMPEEGIPLKPKSHLMTANEILQIATIFVKMGVNKIRLTGGEPLVRKDFNEVLYNLSKLNVELTLTTNGMLVDQFLHSFKESGVKSLNVSIDSLQEDKFARITRRNKLPQLLKNIELLLQNSFLVKLNVVVMKGINDDEIFDFIQLTKYQNIQIRFIEFMPFDGNKWDKSKLVSEQEILDHIDARLNNEMLIRLQDKPNDTAKNFKISNYKGQFAIISSVTNPFCSSCNRIRLTADGKLKNCLFSNSETNILEPLRAGESLEPLILNNILSKNKIRAGMETDEAFFDIKNFSNRSMIAIGG